MVLGGWGSTHWCLLRGRTVGIKGFRPWCFETLWQWCVLSVERVLCVCVCVCDYGRCRPCRQTLQGCMGCMESGIKSRNSERFDG